MMRALTLIACLALLLSGCSLAMRGDAALETRDEDRLIRQTLDDMVVAFKNKDLPGFSSQVSDLYFGDKQRLELRVRRDFNAFHDVEIKPGIRTITPDGMGRVFVHLDFERTHRTTSDNQVHTQAGEGSMIFYREQNRYRLVYQRPTLFGLPTR